MKISDAEKPRHRLFVFRGALLLSVDHKVAEDEARKQNDQGVAEHLEAQLFPFAFGELTHLGRFENAEDHCGREKNKVGVDNKRHL